MFLRTRKIVETAREASGNALRSTEVLVSESSAELDCEMTSDSAYCDLVRISPHAKTPSVTLRTIPFGASSSKDGIDEETLRDLLFGHPSMLFTRAVDAGGAYRAVSATAPQSQDVDLDQHVTVE